MEEINIQENKKENIFICFIMSQLYPLGTWIIGKVEEKEVSEISEKIEIKECLRIISNIDAERKNIDVLVSPIGYPLNSKLENMKVMTRSILLTGIVLEETLGKGFIENVVQMYLATAEQLKSSIILPENVDKKIIIAH